MNYFFSQVRLPNIGSIKCLCMVLNLCCNHFKAINNGCCPWMVARVFSVLIMAVGASQSKF